MPCPYCNTADCRQTARFAADKAARIADLQASIVALGNPGKAERERYVVRELLLNLEVPFYRGSPEMIPSESATLRPVGEREAAKTSREEDETITLKVPLRGVAGWGAILPLASWILEQLARGQNARTDVRTNTPHKRARSQASMRNSKLLRLHSTANRSP
jgi:hypothetical protein